MAALLHLDPSTREDARAKAPPSRRRARAGLTLLAALVVLGVAVAQGDGTVLAAGLLLAAAAVRLLDGGAGDDWLISFDLTAGDTVVGGPGDDLALTDADDADDAEEDVERVTHSVEEFLDALR